MTEILSYLENLTLQVKNKISDYITDKTINNTISNALKSHLEANTDYLDYYLQTVSNTQHFLSAGNFFRHFKKEYSLQAIDNSFLDKLEKQKHTIIQFINNNQLAELYFTYFARAPIRYKNKEVVKDLGSFFTKSVHTFKPNDFCALDNPIKKFFGLSKESFFIAFGVVSLAYKEWVNDHKGLIEQIKQTFKQLDNTGRFRENQITDLKLLDLIFWYEANQGRKNSS
jgi:hypothetical protein